MKKHLLSLMILIGLPFALRAAYIPDGTPLYLDISQAWQNGTYMSAYFWSNSSDGNYVAMTQVANEQNIWKVVAPAGGPWTNVRFRQHSTPVSDNVGLGSNIVYTTGDLIWSGYQSLYAVTCNDCATENGNRIATGVWSFYAELPTWQPNVSTADEKHNECFEMAGSNQTLYSGANSQFLHYQWFEYRNGTWSRLEGTTSSVDVALPSDPNEEVFYYFSGQRLMEGKITNGNFESGNTGFHSDYTYATPSGDGTLYPEGYYTITNNVNAVHSSAPSPQCSHDHTSGYGMMMAINGDSDPNKIVWEQTVNGLSKQTSYVFSAWVMNWDRENQNLAQLEFSINGQLQGARFSPAGGYGNWTQLYAVWNSGDSELAIITLVNRQDALNGNDFAIDDIEFSEVAEYTRLIHYSFHNCTPADTTVVVIEPTTCDSNIVYSKWTDVLFCDNASKQFSSYQWFCNDSPIDGATLQFLYQPQGMSGEYYVRAVKQDGTVVKSCPLTFEAAPRSADISIPSFVRKNEALDIICPDHDYELTIYDMSGRCCMRSAINGSTSIEQHLPSGIYIISVQNTEIVQTQKLTIW